MNISTFKQKQFPIYVDYTRREKNTYFFDIYNCLDSMELIFNTIFIIHKCM